MSAFLLPNAGGGQEPDRVRHSRLVDIYKSDASSPPVQMLDLFVD